MFRSFRSFWTRRVRLSPARPARRPVRTRPELEALEDRFAPALFGPAVNFGTGFSPATVAVGDYNNGGALDLAVVNFDGTVSIVQNDGGANFTEFTGSPINLGGTTEHAVTGLFDGDANLDLLVTNNNGYLSYLSGNGDGTFDPAVNINRAGALFTFAAAGDFNGDGKLDFAASDFSNNVLLSYQGNGDGTFKTPLVLGAGALFNPEQITATDLDGDGKLDLAVSNQGGTVGVTTFRNTTVGTGTIAFAGAQSFSTGIDTGALNPPDFGCTGMVSGDYDGDGKLDLATANYGSNTNAGRVGPAGNTVSVFRNTSTVGAIAFASAVNVTVGTNAVGITQGDFDGNGQLDLAASNNSGGGQISVLLNNGVGGSFAFDAPKNFTVGGAPFGPIGLAVNYLTAAKAIDTNGGRAPELNFDGGPDLAAAVPDGNGKDVAVLLNTSVTLRLSAFDLNPPNFVFAEPVALRTAVFSGRTGLAAPTGTVTFFDGATPLLSFPVNSTTGSALYWTTTSFPIGTHTVTAQYSGDGNYAATTSDPVTVTVAAKPGFGNLFVQGQDNRVYTAKLNASGTQSGGYVLAAPGQVKSFVAAHDAFMNTLLFVIGTDNRVYELTFDSAGNPSGFASTYQLVAAGTVKSIAVGYTKGGDAPDAGGTLSLPLLFVQGTDDRIYRMDFESLGSPAFATYSLVLGGQVKSFQVGADAQHNPLIFAHGTDNRIYSARLGGGGYTLVTGGTVKSFVVSHDTLMRPELFCQGNDDRVYALKFNVSGQAVGGFFLAAGAATVKSYSVVNDGANRPMLFAIGTDDRVYVARFNAAGSLVTGYTLTAAGTVKKLVTGHHDGFGVPELFVVGLDDKVYGQKFTAAGAAAGGYFLTGSLTVKQVGVVP